MVVVILLNQWTPSFVCRPKGQILTEGQEQTCFALMRYLEKQVHMETLHLPSVQIWLGNELESRGIDSMIYSRHIIQLLQQDDEEEIDCPDYFDFNKYKPRVNKKGKVKKPERLNPANLEKTEDRKKSAAIECLQAAVSEEDTGIEILVEELCTKLKEVCKPANLEDPEVLQLSDCSTSADETDTSNSSPELSGDPAERYYAAFPALHGQEKSECGDFSSPYYQDSVDVWKKNPITMSSSEGFTGNFDSGNESEKDSKQRAGRDKGNKTKSENKSNKSSRKKKSTRNQGRNTGKNYDGMGKICRFASWPQDWNYASDSAVDYHKECTIDKERELCSQVENLLKEILLPHAKYDTHDLFGKANKPCYRTAPASLSEDRFSPELQEKDFWYTQPFDDLFEAEEASTPFHQRLYKRHSYPSFECFNKTDDKDILSTTSSPSKKCEVNDGADQHLDDENGTIKDTNDLQTMVLKDNDETFGLQLLSVEETGDGKLDSIDKDVFGLQDLNLNRKVSQHDASFDNDDSFGLQSLMVEKEYFENLLEDNLPDKDILVMPIQELVPDTFSHPNHSSYFLSSSPWTATENDFREVVMPHKDGTEQKRLEDDSNYASPVQNINMGYKTRQNHEAGHVVSDEYQDDKFVNSYDYYKEDNLPFLDSSSSMFDSVLKSNRDSTTSSNSSTSVTTMTEHGSNVEWTSLDSEEKTAVPDYDSFTHPLSSLYASFHTTDFLSPASNTIDHDISIPVDSNETAQASNLPNKFLFGRDADVGDSSAQSLDMRGSSQLAFGEKASQLWDVNYQGKKMLGFTYPWKPFQHLDHLQETTTEPNIMQSVNFTGNNLSDDDASLNTLIPQITFSLISEEEESAFMNDDSDEENVDHHLFSRDCRKDFDRSFSLNELSSLRSKTESISITSNPQLSKSFELVPSEHSAFQDVIPKRIQHAVSEPNLQQYHQDSNQNEPKFLHECLPHTPKKAMDSTSPKEHLFFSPKTHFQPIQTPVGKNSDTIQDASSSDFNLRDLFGGCPKTSKTPYQKFQDARSDSSEESFIPMFKLRKEHDKYIQTNTSISNQTEEPNYGEEYGNICNRCGNIIQVRNLEHEDNECICMEFYQNALEDFDIYGYVDSLTVSEQNTPQNVPKDMKNACTDSGYEDFDTGETGFEGSRNTRYTFPVGNVPPVASIPADNAFECITVEKSSGEKQIFNREDGWVMYKVEGGLGLQCLNEAHIRKNLKYAKAGKEEEDVEEDEVEDGEEFLMHQVEEEWLLNGYYCEGELLDERNYFEYPVSQSVWSTGQDSKTREELVFMGQQFSEREAYIEPCMRKLSESSYSSKPYGSENSFCTRDFIQEVFQPNGGECIQKDSSKLGQDVGNMSNFRCAERFRPTENADKIYGATIEGRQGAPQFGSKQQDEDVVKVKLVFHQRENTHVNLGNQDMNTNTELQENIDPQIFMPMPSQAVFSTDLEEEWLKGKCDEKDMTLQSSLKGAGGKKKPCSFFMEGICRRMDCKFAHDVSNITCRFWEEGDCFKAEMCPFLHGYYPKLKGVASGKKPKGSKFEFQAEDFPDLRKVVNDGDCKSKTVHPKKVAYFDAKASNKNSKRAQMRSGEKGKVTLQKPQCEGKTRSQTNIKCSTFLCKTTSSSAPKNKQ